MVRNELNTEIKVLRMEIDSLHKVNEELKLTNLKYQADKERYITRNRRVSSWWWCGSEQYFSKMI